MQWKHSTQYYALYHKVVEGQFTNKWYVIHTLVKYIVKPSMVLPITTSTVLVASGHVDTMCEAVAPPLLALTSWLPLGSSSSQISSVDTSRREWHFFWCHGWDEDICDEVGPSGNQERSASDSGATTSHFVSTCPMPPTLTTQWWSIPPMVSQ